MRSATAVGVIGPRFVICVGGTETKVPKEGIMAKGQVQRGNTNKAKLTAKEKAKKKMEKKGKAGKS
jgi:hypothetical protein